MNNIGSDINGTMPTAGPASCLISETTDRRAKINHVKQAINNLIANARSDQEFVGSLGKFWGDNSTQNTRLKSIMDSPAHLYTPKISYTSITRNMKKEANEVIDIVKTGFAQLEKPIPQEINRDITLLNSALYELYRGISD